MVIDLLVVNTLLQTVIVDALPAFGGIRVFPVNFWHEAVLFNLVKMDGRDDEVIA